jgi:hypothetical protein
MNDQKAATLVKALDLQARLETGQFEEIGQMADLWAYHHGVRIDFSRPGKPTDNALSKRSTGRSGTNA